MLILLPIVCIVLVSTILWARLPSGIRDLRIAWIGGTLCTIALAVMILEIAGLLHAIGPWSVGLAWVAATVVATRVVARSPSSTWEFVGATLRSLWQSPVALGCLFSIFSLIAVAAFATPPNNYDSLTYHLPRVLYWHQQGTLDNFPTANLRQVEFGPLNALLFLNCFELSGSDASFNFMQGCVALLLLMPATSTLMEYLGAGRAARAVGLVAIAGTPMFILQACSTQNDLLVAAFLTASLALATHIVRHPTVLFVVATGIAVALAILTKGTALIWGLPFAPWLMHQGRHLGLRRGAQILALIASVTLLLNAGYVTRNLRLTGTPFGQFADTNRQAPTIDGTASVLFKNIAVHLTTWNPALNSRLEVGARVLHKKILLVDIDDARTSFANLPFRVPNQWLKEDFSGNPLQLVLVLITATFGAFFAIRRLLRGESFTDLIGFSVSLLLGIIFFSAVLNSQWWVSRLMTPWFVLCLIACAPAWQYITKRQLAASAICCLLVLASLPWLLANETRPLWGANSVLGKTRDQQWFSAWPDRGPATLAARDELLRLRPQSVGFHFTNDVPEYPILAALGGLPKAPTVRHVGVSNYSALPAGQTPLVSHILSNLTDTPVMNLGAHAYRRVWSQAPFNIYQLVDGASP